MKQPDYGIDNPPSARPFSHCQTTDIDGGATSLVQLPITAIAVVSAPINNTEQTRVGQTDLSLETVSGEDEDYFVYSERQEELSFFTDHERGQLWYEVTSVSSPTPPLVLLPL
ncbi:hypothetical protein RRG08_038331 [Elysia crispata]|uniref:Uncharacterized protein n=1 Tax=Elysia crispata TaxID=231223 RepID=A0AAE1APB6_9GAST|nr:hypothetical protein RRG08_038331 [Elysia crispata]